MKHLLSLALLLPLAGLSQDTCGLKKTKDPFTNQVKLSTGFKPFSAGTAPVSISADATPTDIDFFVWVKKEGTCFDEESAAYLVWEGERSRATLRNSGSMNCDGAFHFSFKNTPTPNSWLRKLAAKKLATIKITGSGGKEWLITLTEEQKTTLQRMAICMAGEGAALSKK